MKETNVDDIISQQIHMKIQLDRGKDSCECCASSILYQDQLSNMT